MVPSVARTGTSFKGAALYYLHDKREGWEAERLTSERVAWTSTRNLATDNPDLAWRIMAATALDQDRLKAEAGVKNTGRKSAASVYAYSLAWHPDEKRTLTKSEMLRAADESLRVIGAQDRQAIIICHNDERHPHVHVIVNRVSQDDGRMLGTSNDRVKLSQWAEAYERERGRIWCEQRVANNAKRAQGDFIRASSPTPRSMEKDFDQARGSNENQAKRTRDEAKARAGAISADAVAMHKRHGTEWEMLSKRYRDQKAEIFNRAKAAGERIRSSIRDNHKPLWQDLYRQQGRELRQMKARETRVSGKLANVLDALKARAIGEGDKRSFIAAGFNFLTSRKAREAAILKAHERAKATLRATERRAIDRAMANLRTDRGRQLDRARTGFGSERVALKDRQGLDREQIKARWREESSRRGMAFDTIARTADFRQKAKATRTDDEKAAMQERRQGFKEASRQGRGRAKGLRLKRRRKRT